MMAFGCGRNSFNLSKVDFDPLRSTLGATALVTKDFGLPFSHTAAVFTLNRPFLQPYATSHAGIAWAVFNGNVALRLEGGRLLHL